MAARMKRAPVAQQALEAVGIPVHNNRAVRFEKNGAAFWIAGIADQWALGLRRLNPGQTGRKRYGYDGFDDLPGTLAQVTDTAPTILLVHEPDIFPNVPSRVSLTLAGTPMAARLRSWAMPRACRRVMAAAISTATSSRTVGASWCPVALALWTAGPVRPSSRDRRGGTRQRRDILTVFRA